MNRLDYTKRMLRSMRDRAGYPFVWFPVDNGSTDGTAKWLSSYPMLIANKKNLGISKASNQALDKIGNDFDIIVKVDNDCEFMTNGWLSAIVDIFERQGQFILSPRVEGLRDNPGGIPRTQYVYVGEHFLGLAPHIGGICCAANVNIYRNFRWDEEDFLHGDQDYIFSQMAIKEGYILSYMENVIVEHMDTTEGQIKTHPEYEENRKELKTKRYEKP